MGWTRQVHKVFFIKKKKKKKKKERKKDLSISLIKDHEHKVLISQSIKFCKYEVT